MMIDTFGLRPRASDPLTATKSAEPATVLKLSEEDERQIKSLLKISEDSEVLLRIFKLFNLFFEKFSTNQEAESKKNLPSDKLAIFQSIKDEGL